MFFSSHILLQPRHPELIVEKKSDSPDEDKPVGDASSLIPYNPRNESMKLHMFPGIQRDSDEWDTTYRIRTIVERAINHFKTNMCIAGRKTRNHTTTKADDLCQFRNNSE